MKSLQKNDISPIKIRDLLIIAALLLLSVTTLILMKSTSGTVTARVICNGEEVLTVNLSEVREEYTFSPKDGVKILVRHGEIGFTESDCGTKECVLYGMLSEPFQTAVCIPNGVMITLTSSKKAAFDAVGY